MAELPAATPIMLSKRRREIDVPGSSIILFA
jgi:hypothetical protein